ncbi:hypothetical protein GCM10029992_14240 [Glycomyces albus]
MLPTEVSPRQLAAIATTVVCAVVTAVAVWLLAPTWMSLVIIAVAGGYVLRELYKQSQER